MAAPILTRRVECNSFGRLAFFDTSYLHSSRLLPSDTCRPREVQRASSALGSSPVRSLIATKAKAGDCRISQTIVRAVPAPLRPPLRPPGPSFQPNFCLPFPSVSSSRPIHRIAQRSSHSFLAPLRRSRTTLFQTQSLFPERLEPYGEHEPVLRAPS